MLSKFCVPKILLNSLYTFCALLFPNLAHSIHHNNLIGKETVNREINLFKIMYLVSEPSSAGLEDCFYEKLTWKILILIYM